MDLHLAFERELSVGSMVDYFPSIILLNFFFFFFLKLCFSQNFLLSGHEWVNGSDCYIGLFTIDNLSMIVGFIFINI